jgi:hypothetical protein
MSIDWGPVRFTLGVGVVVAWIFGGIALIMYGRLFHEVHWTEGPRTQGDPWEFLAMIAMICLWFLLPVGAVRGARWGRTLFFQVPFGVACSVLLSGMLEVSPAMHLVAAAASLILLAVVRAIWHFRRKDIRASAPQS